MCCTEANGPRARLAYCAAVTALVFGIIGIFPSLTAHRLYGLFACIGSAMSLIAPSVILCDGRAAKGMYKMSACLAFVSAGASFVGLIMLIVGLAGISTFFESCKLDLCQTERYSASVGKDVPGWQLAICDHNLLTARDCISEEDCLSNASSDDHCVYWLEELTTAQFWAEVGELVHSAASPACRCRLPTLRLCRTCER